MVCCAVLCCAVLWFGCRVAAARVAARAAAARPKLPQQQQQQQVVVAAEVRPAAGSVGGRTRGMTVRMKGGRLRVMMSDAAVTLMLNLCWYVVL